MFHSTEGGTKRHTSPLWTNTKIGTTVKIQKYTLNPPSPPPSTGVERVDVGFGQKSSRGLESESG